MCSGELLDEALGHGGVALKAGFDMKSFFAVERFPAGSKACRTVKDISAMQRIVHIGCARRGVAVDARAANAGRELRKRRARQHIASHLKSVAEKFRLAGVARDEAFWASKTKLVAGKLMLVRVAARCDARGGSARDAGHDRTVAAAPQRTFS